MSTGAARTMKWILLFVIFFFSLLHGQERQKRFQATRVDNPPRIDGRLDDPCWQSIQPIGDFVQFDPVNGAPASETTQVWIAYDSKNIYFAFRMKDSHPEKIWAELTPRNNYMYNDSVTVMLDTYNDRRTSMNFSVNAKNVQRDWIETIWRSGAQVTSDGWTAEMAIPFKSLRFSTAENQVWGINIERYYPRLNETDYLMNIRRDKPMLQQMGELYGMKGVKSGKNIEFFPYLGYRSTSWDGEKDEKLAVGMDFKYGISSNLTLDLTASPDFSQVESDPFIYQLSPYEVYFQERRPFFNEGSQYFDLATEGGGYGYDEPGYSLFYTRRIKSPKFAAKLSGKAGGYSFGVLGALNEEEDGQGSGFSVVRIQKDILENSQIGIYYTGLDEPGNHNHNFAVDYRFNFKDVYYIKGASILTFNSGLPRSDNGLHFLQIEKEVDAGFNWNFDLSRIEKNAFIQTGYVSRTDVQSAMAEVAYGWRFNSGLFKHIQVDLEGSLEQNCEWETTGRSISLGADLELQNMMNFDFRLFSGEKRYQVFGAGDSLSWTSDFFRSSGGDVGVMWMQGGFFKELFLDFEYESRGIYTDDFSAVAPGKQYGVSGFLTLRPRSNLQVGLGCEWMRQVLDATGEEVFAGTTYNVSLHYQFTTSLFLATYLKGETRESQYNLDLLLGYYFGAGNIVQLVYKKNAQKEEGIRVGGDSITLKVSYLLRI